eukprot:7741570-Pyramimonas_sp.AAC.1
MDEGNRAQPSITFGKEDNFGPDSGPRARAFNIGQNVQEGPEGLVREHKQLSGADLVEATPRCLGKGLQTALQIIKRGPGKFWP